jgi:uncharacterized protein (DUF488 family)
VMNARVVLTIGHSTRTLDDFIQLLKENGVTMVIDVRTVPRSRYNPQFKQQTLSAALSTADISYRHMSGLGGLRHPRPDSLNEGWHNASFRGFADYMQTTEFKENMKTLVSLAKSEVLALMCAEAVPWRCHRSLIADALLVQGLRVEHIMGHSARRHHKLTPWAHVTSNEIVYPLPARAS